MTARERFEKKYIPEPNSGCWLWIGATSLCGYGRFHLYERGKPKPAHRVSWFLHTGIMPPDNVEVCHTCDVPCCVNPDHLWLGTHLDNMKDRDKKERTKHGDQRGEKNGNAKLSQEMISAIREDGRPAKIVASEYGVHWATIYKIRSNKLWNDEANHRAEAGL